MPAAHFAYSESLDAENLCQGDVLERTPDLNSLIADIHPTFSRKDNLYFQVLTQSCDLVCNRLKTDYITICPVRPVSAVLGKSLQTHVNKSVSGIPIGIHRERNIYQQFLERLFNNNAQGYFYLDAKGTQFAEDCCALTKLTIALKQEHYQLCLDAKVLQLNDSFQAKLGWLVGNTYSRVGTVDYPDHELRAKVTKASGESTTWVPTEKERRAVLQRAQELGDGFGVEMIPEIIRSIETPKERALSVVQQVLAENTDVPGAAVREIMKKLRNDPELAAIFAK